jgi:hypothetical protein
MNRVVNTTTAYLADNKDKCSDIYLAHVGVGLRDPLILNGLYLM